MNSIYKKVIDTKNSKRKNIRIENNNNDFLEKLSIELEITYTNLINLIIESFKEDMIVELEDNEEDNITFIGSTIE